MTQATTYAGRVGLEIRRVREEQGYTQVEVARRAGFFDHSMVSKMERGSHCTLNNIAAVAGALGVHPRELIP